MDNESPLMLYDNVPNVYNDKLDEIFYKDKCQAGPGEDRSFYEWCSELVPNDKPYIAACIGIRKADVKCIHELTFVDEAYISEKETCDVGKNQTATFKLPVTDETRYTIEQHCYWWLNGKPLPWWATLLIILAIIIAFAIAAWLSWKYWLQRRWQKPKGSTLESRWTSSPVSSTSNVGPIRAPSARAPSNLPSGGGPAGWGGTAGGSRPGRSTSDSRKRASGQLGGASRSGSRSGRRAGF